ncbi:MAG: molybdopterin-dependent oxidoreductase [Candidatus Bathyarchaeota archaeon]|nr:molybdopterin-dependent oxidoreductase [Candidatus Bathyarchaeota archaeon]
MSSKTKSTFNTKLIAAVAIIIIVIAAVAAWQGGVFSQPSISPSPSPSSSPSASPSASPAVTLPAMTLTMIGANGEQVVLNADDMAALESYTSDGGYKSSGGYIAAVGSYTGVPILTLCDLVGGITSTQTLTVTASDGYSMVYTYDQANGIGFTTYDPVTGSEKEATQPMTMVANYFVDGEPLDSDDGPLRIGVSGPEGLLTEGHFWTKMVSKIEITNNVRDWSVTVDSNGDTEPYSMDRQDWTADYHHFTLEWTDDSGNVWKGTALWRWISWYNYNGGISNETLDKGYSVQVISGDGYSATMEGTRVWLNDDIIVAGTLNDGVLSEPYWPLTLVGADVTGKEKVKNIVQIHVVLDEYASPSPSSTATATPSSTAAPTQTPTPTAAPTATPTASPSPSTAPTGDYSLLITGTNQVTMSSTAFEAEVDQVSASYTDSKDNVWTGTTLCRIMHWATSNGAIDSAAIADGYVAKVIAADGTVLAINDSRIDENKDILIANQVNGEAIDPDSGPLRLTGDDLDGGKQRLKCVTEVQILPMNRNITLTVTAANGTSITLFANDLAQMDAITENGGTRNSKGILGNFGAYTGISIMDLLDLVGGVTSSDSVKVTASDGYSSTFTYAQLTGEGIAFYASTDADAAVTPTQPITMLIAYYVNGTSIESGGPLRTMYVGPEGLYAQGDMNAKFVTAIEIV